MNEKNNKKTTDRDYYMFALRIIGDFGASIAVPVVIAVLIGQYLDEKYSYNPLFTILGFVLAALISAKIIHRKAKEYGGAYQNLVDNENIKKKKK
jgi:F0F1-type ATP synthase assembly protein I